MKLSEQQRELLERALDCASTTIITGPESHVKFAETLALIAKAVSIVRDVPGRRLRSDFDAKRQDKRQIPLHAFVGGYTIDPMRPNTCQICELPSKDHTP